MKLIAIGLAGFFGAVTRYTVSNLAEDLAGTGFPWGTLAVNVSGSFLLGFVYAVAIDRLVLIDPHWRTVIAVGFIGSYTTFSTFSLETLGFIEKGSYLNAGANVLVSLTVGLLAVYAGSILGRMVTI